MVETDDTADPESRVAKRGRFVPLCIDRMSSTNGNDDLIPLEVVSKPLNVIQHAREDDRTFKELGDCLMRSHNAFTFFVLFVRFVRFVVAILFQNFKRGNHESHE